MALEALSPADTKRLLELGKTELRPESIITAKIACRAAEKELAKRVQAGEVITTAEIQRIVMMRRNIDGMYARWVRGEFASDKLVEDPFLPR